MSRVIRFPAPTVPEEERSAAELVSDWLRNESERREHCRRAVKRLQLDGLSSDEIRKIEWGLWDVGRKAHEGAAARWIFEDEAKRPFSRASARASWRENDEEISGLPEEAMLTAGEAAYFLELTTQSVYNMSYSGALPGTKQPRGPRGFKWTVPVRDVRKLRVEQEERIARDRAWAFEGALPFETLWPAS